MEIKALQFPTPRSEINLSFKQNLVFLYQPIVSFHFKCYGNIFCHLNKNYSELIKHFPSKNRRTFQALSLLSDSVHQELTLNFIGRELWGRFILPRAVLALGGISLLWCAAQLPPCTFTRSFGWALVDLEKQNLPECSSEGALWKHRSRWLSRFHSRARSTVGKKGKKGTKSSSCLFSAALQRLSLEGTEFTWSQWALNANRAEIASLIHKDCSLWPGCSCWAAGQLVFYP